MIIIILVIGCIAWLVTTLRADSLNAKFDKEGLFTEGIIIDFVEKPSKRMETYYSTLYNYYVNDKLYEAESPINVRKICISTKKLCRGSICKVQYLQSDPAVSRLIVD